MMLSAIWRHPIKGIGTEALDAVQLLAGRTLPLDRAWAIAQEGAQVTPGQWARCQNFIRGAKSQRLMAVTASVAEDGITLRHPDRPIITLDPDVDGDALIAWMLPLWPDTRPPPAQVVRATGQGMTDADKPWVSVMSTASLAALSDRVGVPLDQRRFRGNLWLDGAAPFAEAEWVGKTISIGAATLRVTEPIWRCQATHGNPDTGATDVDVLTLLTEAVGDTVFGVYAEVIEGAAVNVGDPARC